jgi:hypothetical protein
MPPTDKVSSLDRRPSRSRSNGWLALAPCCLMAVGCSEDPQYLEPPMPLEGGLVDATGEPVPATATLLLPIGLERSADQRERAALATALGVQVPYARLGDLKISVEWTLTNTEAKAGKARISLNGGNEFFYYDPSTFVLAGGDEESPDPPALAGNIPLDVPASASISGVFREDQLDELSIDLDQITRGNINPFRAVLQIDEEVEQFQPVTPFDPTMPEVQPTPVGPPIPRRAIAEVTRIDIALESSTRMTLAFNVRVRDLRGLLHERLLAAPVAELTVFAPALYAP